MPVRRYISAVKYLKDACEPVSPTLFLIFRLGRRNIIKDRQGKWRITYEIKDSHSESRQSSFSLR